MANATTVTVYPNHLVITETLDHTQKWNCRDYSLLILLFDIARGKYLDWQSFANDMAEDASIAERVLENKRKGAG